MKRPKRKTTYLIVRSENPRLPPGTIVYTYDFGDVWVVWTLDPESRTSRATAVGLRLFKRRRPEKIVKRLLEINMNAEVYARLLRVTPEELRDAIKTAIKNLLGD